LDLTFIAVLLGGLARMVLLGWTAEARRIASACAPQSLWPIENRAMERVAGATLPPDRAGVAEGMSVVDAGCAPRRQALPVADRVGLPHGSVLAVDIRAEMLSRLKAPLDAAHITRVPSREAALGTLERAVLLTMPSEIPDRGQALHEILLSLKPGGTLSVTEVLPDPHFQRPNTVPTLAERVGVEVREALSSWQAFTVNLARPSPRFHDWIVEQCPVVPERAHCASYAGSA
jgi:SAM-dependent methyltransferase